MFSTPSPPSEAGGTGPAGGRPDFPSPTKLVRNGLTGTELGAQMAADNLLKLSKQRGLTYSGKREEVVTFDKGLWRGVGEPLFSPCQKGINEFVSGSHVAELIQHKKVIDYTATIQWLPHSISTFFGLLRAFHAATLHHTAKRRLDHIQQPTVRL